MKQADAAHTLAEEVGANELKRLREETEKLHLNLKKQRKQYEIVIVQQEKAMRDSTETHNKEAQQLRATVIDIQKAFTAHRNAAERERTRLALTITDLEKERTNVLEQQTVNQDRQKITNSK